MGDLKKTCFVIMGYGVKVDYPTGRQLDLDKTFYNIIQPVCKDLNLECFRAKDVSITGIIDKPMYEWIYKADVVIADLSTLNPNALYELGVRHALRPFSTIVISEDELKYPFDINHTVIDPYEHLGKDIGVSEAERFKSELKRKLRIILSKTNTDSPVYTYLPLLQPPKLSSRKRTVKNKHSLKNAPSISDLIKDAEDAKSRGDFDLAIKILSAALKYDGNNHFIIQRLALATYKLGKPNKISALKKALQILKPINPGSTTDPETLGLCGGIYKRMFEATNKREYIVSALWYYERGFYIAQDYYNGYNVSYLYEQLASLATKKNEAIYYFYHARAIREKIIAICQDLIKKKTFSSRSDAVWIAQTIYQALLGNGLKSKAEKYLLLSKKYSQGKFDQDTLISHVAGLLAFQRITKNRHKISI